MTITTAASRYIMTKLDEVSVESQVIETGAGCHAVQVPFFHAKLQQQVSMIITDGEAGLPECGKSIMVVMITDDDEVPVMDGAANMRTMDDVIKIITLMIKVASGK